MLKVKTEVRRNILFVYLKGELKQEDCISFQKKVISKMEKDHIQNLVVHVGELLDIDLKGAHTLFYIYELCLQNQGHILLCEVRDIRLREKLKNYRVFRYIGVIQRELDAFKTIQI